jgi:hypothetical protein
VLHRHTKGLDRLYDLPSPQSVAHMPMLIALLYMIRIDLRRPFRLSLLRLHSVGFGAWVAALCGFVRTKDTSLEHVIAIARAQAKLCKRILFLSRTGRVFRLWQVVHRLQGLTRIPTTLQRLST